MNMALAIVADIDEKKLEESVLKLVGKVFKMNPRLVANALSPRFRSSPPSTSR